MAEHKQLFVDLDGVLADFDTGVKKICGAYPDQLESSFMWKAIARSSGFYEDLSWTGDGQELWLAVKGLLPVILTGLPHGNWAEPQKRRWCKRELGPEVPVITCLSRNKHLEAKAWIDLDTIPVLIDDRFTLKDDWEDIGGIFIHHTSTSNSLAQLRELGIL